MRMVRGYPPESFEARVCCPRYEKALSRDIPAAFRLIVTPMVRRVSRDSLATSLHQTKIAIDAEKSGRKRN